MRNAAELAYHDLAAPLREKLALRYEDDELNGIKAVSAFNKLLAADSIGAVITFGGQSVAALAPLADAKRIPMLALTADSSLVRSRKYVFQHWLSSTEQARILIQAIEARRYRRLTLVATTHNAALDIRDAFEREARARGLGVAIKLDFLPSQVDFRSELLRIHSAKPDSVVAVLVAPHMGLFARQLRSTGLTLPLFCSANAEVAEEIRAAQGAMEGALYAGPDLDPNFVERFQDRYGAYPEFAAPHIYDSIRLIGAAVEHGALTAQSIRDFLHEITDFQGAMGRYSLEDHFRFAMRATLKEIRNGKIELARR